MSLQIFILGTLSEGEHHPYDIKKIIQSYAENAVTVTDGTLYYHFEALLKKGFIRKVQVVQADNRPEKTTYGITDEGRKALEDEIYASFKNATEIRAIYPSIPFLDKVDRRKLIYLIEDAAERLRKKLDLIERGRGRIESIPSEKREYARLIADHAYQSMKNDLDWFESLLGLARSKIDAD